jgi:hypothetical protein
MLKPCLSGFLNRILKGLFHWAVHSMATGPPQLSIYPHAQIIIQVLQRAKPVQIVL